MFFQGWFLLFPVRKWHQRAHSQYDDERKHSKKKKDKTNTGSKSQLIHFIQSIDETANVRPLFLAARMNIPCLWHDLNISSIVQSHGFYTHFMPHCVFKTMLFTCFPSEISLISNSRRMSWSCVRLFMALFMMLIKIQSKNKWDTNTLQQEKKKQQQQHQQWSQ